MTGSIEDPSGIQDLLLFRLSKIVSIGGGMVTRICEGQFGITRREWAVLALLAQADETRWSRIIEQSELDNARLSRAEPRHRMLGASGQVDRPIPAGYVAECRVVVP